MRFFLILSSLFLLTMTSSVKTEISRSNKDHALFFAVSKYKNAGLTNLDQPIKNAHTIAGELERRYGFKTEVVENPTLRTIQTKLAEYRQKYISGALPADGQLLVFFSGHGVKEYGVGYFLPADTNPDNIISTGLSYNSWRGFINDINCKHILVAVDACYSVTFDPDWQGMGDNDSNRFGRKGELSESDRILANHKSFNARLFFTSDAKEDIVPGRSNFARKLLDGLAHYRSGTAFITAEELFASYIKKAQPTPNAGDFGKDDPRSNFLFFYQTTINVGDARADRAAYQAALEQKTITAYRQYLQDYPNGDFRMLIEQKLKILEAEERELLAWEQTKAQHTKKAYTDFIRDYPNSIYREVAEWKKKALEDIIVIREPPAADNGMVFVKGGDFQMGSNSYSDEKPIHKVNIKDFYIAKYEVTQKLWRDIMGNNPSSFTGDNKPVESVSWNDVQDFIKKLNAKTGKNYRLPTEAEWEYAARGGKKANAYKYAGSNDINSVAWYTKNSYDLGSEHENYGTNPVGNKKANELGLYDMSGNVCEWCQDKWHGDYKNAPKDGHAWASGDSSYRVIRGGSWRSSASGCRVAFRYNNNADDRYYPIGFRLASSL